jgi:hypothetical protein
MASFNIKLDLSKLEKVAVTDIQGKNGRVKCVVIPVEDNNVFVSDKTGSIYIDFTAHERREQAFGQSHIVKRRLSSEKYRAMTQEERNNIPICGSLSPFEGQGGGYQDNAPQPSTSQSSSSFGMGASSNVDLPF